MCRLDRGDAVVETAKKFEKLRFKIKATEGTCAFLRENGVEAEHILKLYEGRPSILDGIKNKEIHLIVNTPAGKLAVTNDAYIRKEAVRHRVPCIHTVAAAGACAEGIAARRAGVAGVKSLQSYHSEIDWAWSGPRQRPWARETQKMSGCPRKTRKASSVEPQPGSVLQPLPPPNASLTVTRTSPTSISPM